MSEEDDPAQHAAEASSLIDRIERFLSLHGASSSPSNVEASREELATLLEAEAAKLESISAATNSGTGTGNALYTGEAGRFTFEPWLMRQCRK